MTQFKLEKLKHLNRSIEDLKKAADEDAKRGLSILGDCLDEMVDLIEIDPARHSAEYRIKIEEFISSAKGKLEQLFAYLSQRIDISGQKKAYDMLVSGAMTAHKPKKNERELRNACYIPPENDPCLPEGCGIRVIRTDYRGLLT